MNELDSEKIAGNLSHNGLEPVGDMSQADVIILNTCSVREKAVQKVYARLGEIRGRKSHEKEVVVGVVGCMAQLEGQKIFQRAPFVNIVAGPQKGHLMSYLLDKTLKTRSPAIDMRMDDDPEPLEPSYVLRQNPWRASVTISEGCNRHCTFCVVPFNRGSERNREAHNIVREIEDLVSQGYVEIVLLGQTVNSYRDPSAGGYTFARLLRRLAEIEGLRRLRFTSPHPNDFTDDLLDVMTTSPKVCNQIHLPVQSGSTRVLRAMCRGYSRERYIEIIQNIRNSARPIAISTDIIVGFPGETESDFRDTLRLLDEVQYDCVYSFKYSPRPNTVATGLGNDLTEEEKGRRLQVLQEQQRLIQFNKNAGHVGETLEVLVEERARSKFALAGRASNNKIVNFDGPESLMGQFVKVKVTGFSANSLKGIWLQDGGENLEES